MEKSPFSRLRKGKARLTMLHEVTEKKQKFQDKWTCESWCWNLRSWSSLCKLNANKGLGSMVSKCAQISTARWTVCSGLQHLQRLMVIILCKKMIELSCLDNMSRGHLEGLWLMPCQRIQKNPLQSSIHLGNRHGLRPLILLQLWTKRLLHDLSISVSSCLCCNAIAFLLQCICSSTM
jgi:hypothetical protein